LTSGFNDKASPELTTLELLSSPFLDVNFDDCVDPKIFSLGYITMLRLGWSSISKELLTSLLTARGLKNQLTHLSISGNNLPTFSQDDVLEIAIFLPVIEQLGLIVEGSTLTVEGAKEWVNRFPHLSEVFFKSKVHLRKWEIWAMELELKAARNKLKKTAGYKLARKGRERISAIGKCVKSGVSKDVMQVFGEAKIEIS
jgi:hypothetical protein